MSCPLYLRKNDGNTNIRAWSGVSAIATKQPMIVNDVNNVASKVSDNSGSTIKGTMFQVIAQAQANVDNIYRKENRKRALRRSSDTQQQLDSDSDAQQKEDEEPNKKPQQSKPDSNATKIDVDKTKLKIEKLDKKLKEFKVIAAKAVEKAIGKKETEPKKEPINKKQQQDRESDDEESDDKKPKEDDEKSNGGEEVVIKQFNPTATVDQDSAPVVHGPDAIPVSVTDGNVKCSTSPCDATPGYNVVSNTGASPSSMVATGSDKTEPQAEASVPTQVYCVARVE